MLSKAIKSTSFVIFGVILLVIITGCSGGPNSNNPIMPESLYQATELVNLDTLPVIAVDGQTAIGVMGGYNLTISSDGLNAELVPIRTSGAIGDSFTVSGRSYFDTRPCKDCFKISGLGYETGKIIIEFSTRHPFQKGNPELPPTGKNRLDLDIFDVALIVLPESQTPVHYALANLDVYDNCILNPDGFTTEIANLTGVSGAMPYKLVIDDSSSMPPSSTFNKFEMGASKDFEVKFPVQTGDTLVFDLFLTFGYGASAIFANRFSPTYYNPEFNRKAAWKVAVSPPNGTDSPELGNTWDDSDSATEYDVTVKVYDWQIGANVDTNLTNPTDIYSASDVDYIKVEIPGMTGALKQVDGNSFVPGGTGMPDSPLVYTIPIANENLLGEGVYIGLVEVADVREPLEITQGRDFLIHTPDGGNLSQYQIPGYRTYQTFTATVVAGTSATGNLSWAKDAGGTGYDYPYGVTTLSDNSTVVSGSFVGPATFGPGETNETILNSVTANWDIFIARYNPDGSLVWAKSAGGEDEDVSYGITSFSDNSTAITGYFEGTITFGEGEPNETALTCAGDHDILIAKYNADGSLAWAKNSGGYNWQWFDYEYGQAITSLSDNSIVVTGSFDESATFGKGEPNEITLTADFLEIFVAKYNPNGSLAWAKRAGGEDDEAGYAITSLSDNSTVVSGYFRGSATFGPGEANQTILNSAGSKDIFVARYNTDGSLSWAKRAGGSNYDTGYGITTLSDNSTVVTGSFAETATFGEGEPNETDLLNPDDWYDMFVAKFNANGSLAWAIRAGGPDEDIEGFAITSLSDNSTVVTGLFYGPATFGEGETNESVLTSVGSNDMFIARFNPDGTFSWAKSAGGPSGGEIGYGVTSLTDDSTVVAGTFFNSATFGLGETNETDLTSFGQYDVFVARFEP